MLPHMYICSCTKCPLAMGSGAGHQTLGDPVWGPGLSLLLTATNTAALSHRKQMHWPAKYRPQGSLHMSGTSFFGQSRPQFMQ